MRQRGNPLIAPKLMFKCRHPGETGSAGDTHVASFRSVPITLRKFNAEIDQKTFYQQRFSVGD
jgi:hypothetical protein